ncbi:MAG: PIN domain-containing protein [bacterium]
MEKPIDARNVTDTHSLLWYLLRSKRLSPKAAAIFSEIDEGKGQIHIPTIVLVEIVYLMEKAKIPKHAIKTVINMLDTSPSNYSLSPITLQTIRALQSISRKKILDMPDRIISATAANIATVIW